MAKIELMRVYDIEGDAPEHAFLVDRLWPRGVSKVRLQGVEWLKEVAPSNQLRVWFHQHTDSWQEFERRYIDELNAGQAWKPLAELLAGGTTVYLLFASKNTQRNQAIVLRDFLLRLVE